MYLVKNGEKNGCQVQQSIGNRGVHSIYMYHNVMYVHDINVK